MSNERVYQTAKSHFQNYFDFRNDDYFAQLEKLVKIINNKLFSKSIDMFFSEVQKRNICERALSRVYLCKISSRCPEKSLPVQNFK